MKLNEILTEQKWVVYDTKTGKVIRTGMKRFATAIELAQKGGENLKVASDKWFADNKDNLKEGRKALEEGFIDELKRKLSRISKKAAHAFYFGAENAPKVLQKNIKERPDDHLLMLIKRVEDRRAAGMKIHPENEMITRLATRELKKRYNVSLSDWNKDNLT